MEQALRARIVEALGAGAVAPGDIVTPPDRDAAAAAVRLCAEAGTRFMVLRAGAGDRAAGNDTVVRISVQRLQSTTLSPANLTMHAEAAAAVDAVRAQAAGAGLAVVGLSPHSVSATVAELVERGEVPRRALCGIDAVLPTGERVTFGGAVLKDVVGYDLPALLLGSMGRLAVLLALEFRLEPEGARTPVADAPGPVADARHALLARAFDPDELLQPNP